MPTPYAFGILQDRSHSSQHAIPARKISKPMRNTVLALAVALTGGICMLDYASGPRSETWLLYLAPIGLASFVLGARYGYVLILLAGVLQFLTSGLPGVAYPSFATFVGEHGAAASVYVVCVYVAGVMRALRRQMGAGGPLDALTRPK